MIRPTLLLLMCLPGLAGAQVYKCSGKSGEAVYSQAPCTANAQPHVLRNGQVAGSNLRVDRQCMDQARASIYAAANDRMAALQQQIKLLGEAGNNTPRIAQLEQNIRAENRQANQQVTAARQDCMRPVQTETEAAPVPVSGQSDT